MGQRSGTTRINSARGDGIRRRVLIGLLEDPPVGRRLVALVRLAVLSDIHGNFRALEAVLADLRDQRVEEFVCLGDVVLGPQPTETLGRVRALGCPVVMGNWGRVDARRLSERTG